MELRTGFTTGTCAAAASKAAATLLYEGYLPSVVELVLPRGELVSIPIYSGGIEECCAWASVIKDAGDDPDVTAGIEIRSDLVTSYKNIFVAGDGVGTVTKRGLQVPVGEAAINPVPREMIIKAIGDSSSNSHRIKISAVGGSEIAKKTFNPRLGIEGGISIIGTTGIVRPYNRDAMQASIKLNLNVLRESPSDQVILTPGNIGTKSAIRHFNCTSEDVVELGNEWGFGLDNSNVFNDIKVIGHPGKLCKLIRGDFYTRSGDSRPCLEIVEQKAQELSIEYEESKTVEGMFTQLKAEDQRILGDALSREIRFSILDRVPNRNVLVTLTIMSGDIVGSNYE